MSDAGVSSSSPGAAAVSPRCLTLRDYLLHQRALKELQRGRDVWIVDELLELRYRARLELCLAPRPQLRLTDTADESVATLIVPLDAACRVDTAGEGPDAGLRLASSSECPVRLVHLVPADAPASEGTSAVATAWATVLRQLCRPVVSALMAAVHPPASPPPPPLAAVPSVTMAVPAHVDPSISETRAITLPTALSEQNRGPGHAQSSPLRALIPHDAEDISSALDDLTHRLSSASRTSAELLLTRQPQHQRRRPASASPASTRTTHPAVTDAAPAEVPRRESSGHRSSGADAALSLDSGCERERPPTMAHAGVGLVPQLGSHPALRITASFAGADEEEDDDAADGGGLDTDADGAQGTSGGDAGGGVHVDGSLTDSTRPQAPRGGHVGDLGSLGPPRDDAEALRMYNEIHGIHSSSSSSNSESSLLAPNRSSHREPGTSSATAPSLEQQHRGPSA